MEQFFSITWKLSLGYVVAAVIVMIIAAIIRNHTYQKELEKDAFFGCFVFAISAIGYWAVSL